MCYLEKTNIIETNFVVIKRSDILFHRSICRLRLMIKTDKIVAKLKVDGKVTNKF